MEIAFVLNHLVKCLVVSQLSTIWKKKIAGAANEVVHVCQLVWRKRVSLNCAISFTP
jgi:hypothetical protein